MTQSTPTGAAPTRPISRWPVPELMDLPEDLKARILEVQSKAGFVPNVFLALAHRPDELRAFLAYHDALLLKPELEPAADGSPRGLSKGEREMIIVATSGANHCLYCVVAHGAILRIYEKKPLVADQIAINHRKADITPRQRAMLDFAMKVCVDSVQPHGQHDRHAAQRRVLPDGAGAAFQDPVLEQHDVVLLRVHRGFSRERNGLADEFAQARQVHALFIEQHLHHRRAGHDAEFARLEAPCLAQDFAQHVVADGARGLHLPAAVAGGARLAQQVGQ